MKMVCLFMAITAMLFALCSCGEDTDTNPIIETTGTVAFTCLEGGVWYISATDGEIYVSDIPDKFKLEGKRVHVKLEDLPDQNSAIQFGNAVKILRIWNQGT